MRECYSLIFSPSVLSDTLLMIKRMAPSVLQPQASQDRRNQLPLTMALDTARVKGKAQEAHGKKNGR